MKLKCIWCGKGKGKHFTKNSNNEIYYYVCKDDLGFIVKEQNEQMKALLQDEGSEKSESAINKIEAIIIEASNKYLYFPKIPKIYNWAILRYQQKLERSTQITIMETIDENVSFGSRTEIVIDRIYVRGEKYEETLKRVRTLMDNYRKIKKCLSNWDFKEEIIILDYLGKKLNRYLKKIVEIHNKEREEYE